MSAACTSRCQNKVRFRPHSSILGSMQPSGLGKHRVPCNPHSLKQCVIGEHEGNSSFKVRFRRVGKKAQVLAPRANQWPAKAALTEGITQRLCLILKKS